MKYWIFALCLGLGVMVNAQTKVKIGDKDYEVKNERIFKEGKDITDMIPLEEKKEVLDAAMKKEKIRAEKESLEDEARDKRVEEERKTAEAKEKKLEEKRKEAEKEEDKLEKERKAIEKEEKQAEKEVKQIDKAKSDYKNAGVKHKEAIEKYEKLKSKGKLSPVDEEKWLKKIEKLKESEEKAKRKL